MFCMNIPQLIFLYSEFSFVVRHQQYKSFSLYGAKRTCVGLQAGGCHLGSNEEKVWEVYSSGISIIGYVACPYHICAVDFYSIIKI